MANGDARTLGELARQSAGPPTLRAVLTGQPFTPMQGPPVARGPSPPPNWLDRLFQFGEGFLTGAPWDQPSGAHLGGELLSASLPFLGAARGGLRGLREGAGFYSRVDRIASQIPVKGAHPNKIASLLRTSRSRSRCRSMCRSRSGRCG